MSRIKKNLQEVPSGSALRDHRDCWERIALSTVPANRSEIESQVGEFYRNALKCNEPKYIWVDSPRQAKRAQKGIDFDWETGKIIDNMFHDASVQAQKHTAARFVDQALVGLHHPLYADRRSLFWDWMQYGVTHHLRSYAFVDFFVTNIGLFKTLKPWLTVLAGCGGFWFRKETIVLLDTPEILRADDQHRLHCEGGAALRYRDGLDYYFLHGIRVQKKYVFAEANEISMTEVLKQPNSEVRLALISKVGFPQLLGTVRHWTISEAHGNSLLEFRIKGVQFLRALHVRWQDKTGQKETVIPVPSRRSEFGADCPEDIDDCEQVRRWTLGWPKEALAIAET
jgi:hypothetical protein